MRGIASIAKLVIPAAASALLVSAEVRGARWPISRWPVRSLPMSSTVGTATTVMISAPQGSPISAPASMYSESGCPAPSPAPASDDHVDPALLQRGDHVGDQRHAALARSGF